MSWLISVSLQTVDSSNVHIAMATNRHMKSRSSVPASPRWHPNPEIVYHSQYLEVIIKPMGLISEKKKNDTISICCTIVKAFA